MITPEELEEGLKLLGPYKKFPHYFVDYPEVNVLLDLLPKALEEIKRMRAEEYTEALLLARLENAKLLRVKEAAEAERKAGNFISHELWDALKALDEEGK
jgi:hypothetical protein